MATVSRGLPQRPHLDIPKREARELLKLLRAGELEALDRIRRRHPKFHSADNAAIKSDPSLVERHLNCREIYPPELGCAEHGRSGMHGTPLDGTTLLHLAIDFDEQEIFDLLLARGADANARALVDADGFGGHTPLFNAVVSCAYTWGRQRDASMTGALLQRGASSTTRATLRKFLDWRDTPGWHEAREVTPAEWGRNFPEEGWVNLELRMLDAATHRASG